MPVVVFSGSKLVTASLKTVLTFVKALSKVPTRLVIAVPKFWKPWLKAALDLGRGVLERQAHPGEAAREGVELPGERVVDAG